MRLTWARIRHRKKSGINPAGFLPAMEHPNHAMTSTDVCADADLGANPAKSPDRRATQPRFAALNQGEHPAPT